MNIQQIEYIIAVSEIKNFGKAAEKCFVTQSTLSTMIARMEAEIGITIFDRKTKPVTITKEGEQIIKQLKIISKEIGRLQEVVDDMKGELSGTLTIGVIPTIAPYLLPLFLKNFVEQFPNIKFTISEITTEKILEQLEKRELDIGIVSTPLRHPHLVEIPLYQESFVLYDRADNKPNDNFNIANIDTDRLWLLEDGHCMRTQVESICGLKKRSNKNSNLDYKSGTINTLMKFVNKNNGTTLLPYLATLDAPLEDQKHMKRFSSPVPSRTIGLIVHEHFVKKGILELMQLEIQEKVIPLLGKVGKHKMINPV